MAARELNGSEMLVELLKEQGVDTVFGYPGGSVLNIYDALHKHADEILHVLTSHEQGAAHAADGWARATGRTGVCIATSGPGATNLVTGIATAMLDSVPMVAITGNVALPLLGKDSFQEVDIYGITMPITKHNFIVKDVAELPGAVRRAFEIARTGRPGPVLIDIPKDITAAKGTYEPAVPAEIPRKKVRDAARLREAAAMIAAARRPFVYGGGGIIRSGAAAEFAELVARADAPVALSLMGLSAFPSAHPAFTGMIGMHGTRASNAAITECDLVIAVGARFSDRVVGRKDRFAPGAKVLHIDVDPAEINKNVGTDCHLSGDIKETLAALLQVLEPQGRADWMERVRALKAENPLYPQAAGKEFRPADIVRAARSLAGEGALVVTDVGQHQMWVGQCWDFARPGSFLSSGGMGTMGYSMGAAIGASLACMRGRVAGARKVVCFVGDGGFRMNCNELATAARYGADMVVVLVNNGVLGMVRQWQRFFYDGRYSQTTLDRPPDFVKLADAFGVPAARCEDLASFEAAFARALDQRGPFLVECRVGPDELVLPMVPPGAPIDEQMLN